MSANPDPIARIAASVPEDLWVEAADKNDEPAARRAIVEFVLAQAPERIQRPEDGHAGNICGKPSPESSCGFVPHGESVPCGWSSYWGWAGDPPAGSRCALGNFHLTPPDGSTICHECEAGDLRVELNRRRGDPVTRLHNLAEALEKPLACGHRLTDWCDNCETCGSCRDAARSASNG